MNIFSRHFAFAVIVSASYSISVAAEDNPRISTGHGGGASESSYDRESNRSDTSLYTFYGLADNPNNYDATQYKKTVTINNSGDIYGYCKQSTNQYEDVFAREPAILIQNGSTYRCSCQQGYDPIAQGRDQDSSGNWTVTYYACAVSGSGYVAIDQPDEPAPPPPPEPEPTPDPTPVRDAGWQGCWGDTNYEDYLRKKRAVPKMYCY